MGWIAWALHMNANFSITYYKLRLLPLKIFLGEFAYDDVLPWEKLSAQALQIIMRDPTGSLRRSLAGPICEGLY